MPMVKCILTVTGKNSVSVTLEHPMRALSPGQYATFYLGDICLGSAKIIKQGPSMYDLNIRERIKLPAGFT